MHEAERGVDHVMDAAIDCRSIISKPRRPLVHGALRSLKHETLSRFSTIMAELASAGAGPEGVYFNATRFLSWYETPVRGDAAAPLEL